MEANQVKLSEKNPLDIRWEKISLLRKIRSIRFPMRGTKPLQFAVTSKLWKRVDGFFERRTTDGSFGET